MLVSLINLSLSCYPDNLGYADQVLGFAKEKMVDFGESPDLQHKETVANLQNLLMAPIQHYPSILTLMELPHYTSLLALQPYQTRRAIAHAVVGSILKNETVISTPEEVNGVLEICAVMVRDQKDGGHNSSPFRSTRNNRNESGSVDLEEFTEEQGQLARIIHLFKSDDADVQAAVSFPLCFGILLLMFDGMLTISSKCHCSILTHLVFVAAMFFFILCEP